MKSGFYQEENMFSVKDFNVVEINSNGHFIRIEELNKMVECGVIAINREKLEEYKTETRKIKL